MDLSLYTILAILTTLSFLGYTSCDQPSTSTESTDPPELCLLVGAHCVESSSRCSRRLVHSWGIHMCEGTRVCCAHPVTSTVSTPDPVTISNHLPLSPTSRNQCQQQQGVCITWYNRANCNGTIVQQDCGSRLKTCCIQSNVVRTSREHVRRPSTPSPPPTSTEARVSSDMPAGECGRQIRAPRQKRIVGGSLSLPGTWPWHVGISSALGYIHCAGTIINDTWILTAAHCFKRIRDHSMYRIVTETQSRSSQKSYSINRIIKHSLYQEHTHAEMVGHSHKYDIALVQLNERIVFSNNVQKACLPSLTQTFEGQTCWLTGWGSTRFNSTEEGFRLRHVRGAVLSSTVCQSQYWGNLVDTKMVCFGNGNRGGCTGDSGGGMFCEDSDGRYTLAGVISWGSLRCNTGATVLTDIAQYHTWIQETMAS